MKGGALAHSISEAAGESEGAVDGEGGGGFHGWRERTFFRKDAHGHVQLPIFDPGVSADWRLAAGTEEAEELALGLDAGFGFRMINLGEDIAHVAVLGIHFDGDGPLAGGREELLRIKDLGVELLIVDGDGGRVGLEQLQAHEPGGGEDDGVERIFTEALADAGGHVAAQIDDLHIGPQHAKLSGTTDAAGADGGSFGQGIECEFASTDEDIFNGCSLEHGGDGEVLLQL